jgi:hypothetical protein
MSTPIDNGGPAFPVQAWNGEEQVLVHVGMTLRDWFAGQAMIGMLSSKPITFCAEDAYTFADAMLAARKEKP